MNKEIKEILLKFNKEVEKAESARNPFSSEDKKFKHILVALSEEHFNIFKDILDYITNLQQYYNDNVNKYEELLVKYSDLQQKVDQYENPDDLTLFYMWLDEKAKDKIKQLEEENERYKRIFEAKEKFSKIMSKDIDFIILSKADYDRQLEDIELNAIKLKSRNEKAIEYGKELRLFDNESLEFEIGTNFINILQGSDKE